LKQTDLKVYRALQSLESQQDGLCTLIVANHRTISRCAKINLKTVGKSLARLKEKGLIRYEPGDRDYAKKCASEIRRFSLDELRASNPAEELAAILNKRSIQYGSNIVRPTYKRGITNRLYSSQPNVQSKKKLRPRLLAAGCKDDENLVELDLKAAEPTIISHELGYDKDGYQTIAEAEGRSIDEVKKVFNPIVYARSTAINAAKVNGFISKGALNYFSKVDELRSELRSGNKRHVVTRAGSRIDCPTDRKCHKGTLLSYLGQGTIADFINKAALEIIALEKAKGWRLVTLCHDAVYVICKPEQIPELHDLIMSNVIHYDMQLKSKTQHRVTT
jgi:hypothetical protein